jgi:ferritin-like metal-binding protein YciE
VQGLIAEADEFLEKEADKADPDVVDAALIGQAQRVEHYEIAAYGTARTYARQLGLVQPAKILQQILDQEGATDKKLTKLAEGGINKQAENGGAVRTARSAGAGSNR